MTAATTAATKPVLGYWAIRGLGQHIRLLLSYMSVEFVDKTYELPLDSEGKYSHPGSYQISEWMKEKFTLGLDFPNLPYFMDGDYKITETLALITYICSKYKPELLGETPEEKGLVSMLGNLINDLKGKMTIGCYKGTDKEEMWTQVEKLFSNISNYLGEKTYLTGKLTWVDIVMYETLELANYLFNDKVFTAMPNLKKLHSTIGSIPSIVAFRKEQGPKPFNNKIAQYGATA